MLVKFLAMLDSDVLLHWHYALVALNALLLFFIGTLLASEAANLEAAKSLKKSTDFICDKLKNRKESERKHILHAENMGRFAESYMHYFKKKRRYTLRKAVFITGLVCVVLIPYSSFRLSSSPESLPKISLLVACLFIWQFVLVILLGIQWVISKGKRKEMDDIEKEEERCRFYIKELNSPCPYL